MTRKTSLLLITVCLSISVSFGFTACGVNTDDRNSNEPKGELAEGLNTCPDPIIIQTDWFPEAEHGALYELFGDGAYSVDANNLIVSGTVHDLGTNTGLGLEVRTGGPAIGYSPVASEMYTDQSITLGYANTEGQITRFDKAPLLSIVAPLEKNPQMIMWDPNTYPDVETLTDLGEKNITISVFFNEVFSDVFVAQEIWSADQVDRSYEGSPANFIASGGSIAQQGFASAEPFDYKNTFEEWGKDVKFQLLHDAGFKVYSQTIAIRPDDKTRLDTCLRTFVPVIQRAVLSYESAPETANNIIIDAVEKYGRSWVYGKDIATYSIETQRNLGLLGNGPNSTVGDMEESRIRNVIDIMAGAGIDTSGVTPADIFTNEYIDKNIGFK
ncbi:MAG: hypothetical protein L7S58_08035 [Acidimicrobiales bacterium]|nr:hypothetical protein [Acidimicrobiales bacterium]